MRWRLVVAYDGGRFHGFAAQPGVVTVAGSLAEALARSLRIGEPPALTCAGRTDTGVHALGQVVHVDLPEDLPEVREAEITAPMSPDTLVRALNRQLSPAVVVRTAEPAPTGFDARRSATGRHYRYLVLNAAVPDPRWANLAWHVPDALDLRAMVAASDSLLGEHDFRSFCRRPPGTSPGDPIIRVVRSVGWTLLDGPEWRWPEPPGAAATGVPVPRMLRFDIAATSFCHQMVRSLVSTLVEVGRGRMNVAAVVDRLRATDRAGGVQPAPPQGLCLWEVAYPPDL